MHRIKTPNIGRVLTFNGFFLLLGLWPLVTYMPELYQVKRSGREGLSSWTCLITSLVGILRLAFWIVRRVRAASYATYSICLILVQLMLLDALVSMKKKNNNRQEAHFHRASSAQLASHSRKFLRACMSGRRETAFELWKKVSSSFWNWDELDPYVEVLVVSALIVIFITVLFVRIKSRDGYIRCLELVLGFLEACIPLPHLFRQCFFLSHPDLTRPIHYITLLCWFCRDAYIFYTCQPEDLPTLRGRKVLRFMAAFRIVADSLVIIAQQFITYNNYTGGDETPGATKNRRGLRARFFTFLFARPRVKPSVYLTAPKFQKSNQDFEALLDHTNSNDTICTSEKEEKDIENVDEHPSIQNLPKNGNGHITTNTSTAKQQQLKKPFSSSPSATTTASRPRLNSVSVSFLPSSWQ